MNSATSLKLTLTELCQATRLGSDILIEIIEEGILEPTGSTPETWQFSNHTIAIAQKAARLHNDLEIDWPGIALAISLIEELEQLRDENQQLRQQLKRFTPHKP